MASLVLKMSVSLDGDGAAWTVETLENAGAPLVDAATYAAWAGWGETAVATGGAVAHVFTARA